MLALVTLLFLFFLIFFSATRSHRRGLYHRVRRAADDLTAVIAPSWTPPRIGALLRAAVRQIIPILRAGPHSAFVVRCSSPAPFPRPGWRGRRIAADPGPARVRCAPLPRRRARPSFLARHITRRTLSRNPTSSAVRRRASAEGTSASVASGRCDGPRRYRRGAVTVGGAPSISAHRRQMARPPLLLAAAR